MLRRVELYLYFMRTWVRPSLRELLNSTDRCPFSRILVPLSRLPRSRSRTNGQPSSITCWRSWDLLRKQRNPRSRFLATLHFTSLLTWPGDGTCSSGSRSRSRRISFSFSGTKNLPIPAAQATARDQDAGEVLFDKGHRMGKVWSERI